MDADNVGETGPVAGNGCLIVAEQGGLAQSGLVHCTRRGILRAL